MYESRPWVFQLLNWVFYVYCHSYVLSVLHINLVFEEALVEHPELDSEFSLCSASMGSMLFSVQQLELESLELPIPMLLATH